MADVASLPSLFDQIALIAGLRWRILRNHLRQKNNWLDFVGMSAAAIGAAFLIIGISFAVSFGAYSSLSSGHMIWLTLLYFAIFGFWILFPLFVAGFGVDFQFRALLRFPLKLSAFYLISLAYGFADFAAIASVCWLIAMIIGAGAASLSVVPAMILIALLLILMCVTFARLLGSWMERLLAQRRTRELVFGLVILLSVSAQFIKPLIDHFEHGPPQILLRAVPYLSVLPPGLAGRAISAAVAGQLGTVGLFSAGLCAYIAFFSALLWFRYAAQYSGEELSEAPSPAARRVRPASSADAGSDIFRVLSPAVAAVLQKELRYLFRNSFLLISLFVPPFLVLLFSSQFSSIPHRAAPKFMTPDLFFPGMMGYLLLMLMMPVYNSFAYEGRGIQTYLTSPVRFRDVFLAKNLLHVGILAFEVALSTILLAWRVGLPPLSILIATLFGGVFAVAGQFSLANWTSLSFPRKLEFGSMRGQRGSGVAVWVGFGAQLVLGAICSLVVSMGRWTGNPWLPAEAFAVLAAASIAGYFASLDAMTGLADRKKETLIETLCR